MNATTTIPDHVFTPAADPWPLFDPNQMEAALNLRAEEIVRACHAHEEASKSIPGVERHHATTAFLLQMIANLTVTVEWQAAEASRLRALIAEHIK